MIRHPIARPAVSRAAAVAPTLGPTRGRMPGGASAGLALAFALLLSGCASFGAVQAFERGTTALDRGETERAVAELERAAALAPASSAVHNHLGIAYEASGRPDDALRAYERAVELDCENGAAQQNLRALRARGSVPGS